MSPRFALVLTLVALGATGAVRAPAASADVPPGEIVRGSADLDAKRIVRGPAGPDAVRLVRGSTGLDAGRLVRGSTGPDAVRLVRGSTGPDAVRASARREGLVVNAVRAGGPGELQVACGGPLTREAFLKRASLVAYAAFHGDPALRAIAFEHTHGPSRQAIRVATADLTAYLGDRIPRAEYHRRLAYRTTKGPATAAGQGAATPRSGPAPRPPSASALRPPAPPVLPEIMPAPSLAVMPASSRPALPASTWPAIPAPPGGRPAARPHAAPHPIAAPAAIAAPALAPTAGLPLAAPPAATDLTFAWSLGLGRAAYDAYAVEYDHPLLPTLSLRPALWILSAFSPLNRLAGPTAGMDGLSGSVDLVGSTRKQVGPAGLALEGGLGLRATTLQALAGAWPAAHLRVGARWQAVGLAMRYPLLARGGDPTATWEASLGLAWSFGGAAAP